MIFGDIKNFLKSYEAEYEKEIAKLRKEFESKKSALKAEDEKIRKEMKQTLVEEIKKEFEEELEREKLYKKIEELEREEKQKEEIAKEIINKSLERVLKLKKSKKYKDILKEFIKKGASLIDEDFILIQPAKGDELSKDFVKKIIRKKFRIIKNGNFSFGIKIFNKDKTKIGDFSLEALLETKKIHLESLLLKKLDEMYG
jgi:vacuolar-type H+-ATPase subunit E/Vma4